VTTVDSTWRYFSPTNTVQHFSNPNVCFIAHFMQASHDSWVFFKQVRRKCKSSALEYKPRRIFGVVQRFGENYSCHPQGEYILVGRSWSSYIGRKCLSPIGEQPAFPLHQSAPTHPAKQKTTKIDQDKKLVSVSILPVTVSWFIPKFQLCVSYARTV
jgi:hypothetical protein